MGFTTGGVALTSPQIAAMKTSLRALGLSVIEEVSVELSASNLNHLFSAPVELVAAPGAGKVAVPLWGIMKYSVGSHTYYTGPNYDHPMVMVGSAVYLQELFDIDSLADNIKKCFFTQPVDPDNHPFLPENSAIKLGNSLGGSPGADLIAYGDVTACSLSAGGAGYSIGDTGTWNFGFSGGAYTVTGVDGGGAVTSFTFAGLNGVRVGDIATTNVTTGGGDGNFSAHVDTVIPGNGTALLKLVYQIADVA